MKLISILILTLLTPRVAHSEITKISLLAGYMDSTNISCSDYNTQTNSFEWHATCNNNLTTSGGAQGVQVRGIALCSTFSFSSAGETQGKITDSFLGLNAPGEPIYCWCKMVMPFTSPWVGVASYQTTYDTSNGGISQENCTSQCAQACVNMLINSQTFRHAMLTNMYN